VDRTAVSEAWETCFQSGSLSGASDTLPPVLWGSLSTGFLEVATEGPTRVGSSCIANESALVVDAPRGGSGTDGRVLRSDDLNFFIWRGIREEVKTMWS